MYCLISHEIQTMKLEKKFFLKKYAENETGRLFLDRFMFFEKV